MRGEREADRQPKTERMRGDRQRKIQKETDRQTETGPDSKRQTK